MITTEAKNNRKSVVVALGTIVVCAMVIAFIIITIISSYATGVSVNGKTVGFVENEAQLAALIDDVRNDLSKENYSTDIQLSEEAIEWDYMAKRKDEVSIMSADQLKEELIDADTVDAIAGVINVNGEPILYVGNQNDAESVLLAAKQKYAVEGHDVISEFKENVTVSEEVTDITKLMSTEAALTYLTTGNEEIQTYTVKENDTDWDIAIAHGLTEKDIQDANPDMDTEVIKEGDILNISEMKPFVNVEVTATITEKEEVKYDKKEIETDELYVGETQVKDEGKKGEILVTSRAIYVNGEKIDSDVLEEKVIKEPKTKVVVVGTKEKTEYEEMNSDKSTDGDNGSYIGGNGTLSKPMKNLEISSPFGMRNGRLHAGTDFRNPAGTSIYAADGGRVIYSGWQSGYGKTVQISHGNGVVTLYGHCSSLFVSEGDYVSRGEKIAAVGSTGRSTGNHLHFEVRINGTPKNPMKYL